MGIKHETHIIGNRRNTEKQKVSIGNVGFYTSALAIEILLARRRQTNSNSVFPGYKIIYIYILF